MRLTLFIKTKNYRPNKIWYLFSNSILYFLNFLLPRITANILNDTYVEVIGNIVSQSFKSS